MEKKLFSILWLLQYFPEIIYCLIESNPMIRIPQGLLMGETGNSDKGLPFYKFWCIPFGKAERWEPSEMADPWTGVKDATSCSVQCPQVALAEMGDSFGMSVMDQEDCLILNIFVPAKLNKTLPVMFWVHGGYFVLGSSLTYSGEMFVDHEIILVTINYRLGAMGFLTTGDGVIDANLGMKDCVLALKWVRDNIQYFGGDPGRVTIFGESAGGAATGLLVLSPLTKGLFHHAIAHSGSALIPCAYQGKPKETFLRFSAALNCTQDTTEERVLCLKEIPSKTICERLSDTKWMVTLLHPTFPAIEVGDNLPRKSEAFLPAHPRRMLQEGNFNHVPLTIGIVEDEGSMFVVFAFQDEELMHDVNYKWVPTAGYAIGVHDRNMSQEGMYKGLRKARYLYFGDEELNPTASAKQAQALTDAISDGWFIVSMDTTIRYHSKYAPVYPYIFTKKGGLGLATALAGPYLNKSVVGHGEELTYLFFKGISTSKSDKLFSKRFLTLWTSFAREGKPTGMWGSAGEWTPAEHGTFDYKYLILDDDTKMMVNPFKEHAMFFHDLNENEWKDLNY